MLVMFDVLPNARSVRQQPLGIENHVKHLSVGRSVCLSVRVEAFFSYSPSLLFGLLLGLGARSAELFPRFRPFNFLCHVRIMLAFGVKK